MGTSMSVTDLNALSIAYVTVFSTLTSFTLKCSLIRANSTYCNIFFIFYLYFLPTFFKHHIEHVSKGTLELP